MQPPAVTVSASPVDVITWQPVIEAFGTVGSVQGVELAARTTGVVREILFSANDRVEQGQLLVQIDDAVERAELISASAAVERDRQALERARTLSDRGVSSTANLETAESELAASSSQLQRLEAVLDQKAIKAPFSGVMGIPRIEIGQYVSAGDEIATLQNLDQMRVDFTVREQDIDRIAIGQPVRSGVAVDELDFEGRITGIEPRVDPASRLVAVRAEIQNAEGKLRPGQFARVEVMLPEQDGIIAVPQTAVISSLYGDFVYVVSPVDDDNEPQDGGAREDELVTSSVAGKAQAEEGGEPEQAKDDQPQLMARQVFVRPGRRSGGIVEIVDGLQIGQRVVSAGQNKLFNGARVIIDNTVDAAELSRGEGQSR
jgi:membrane fusion protein, multidrug efflux system